MSGKLFRFFRSKSQPQPPEPDPIPSKRDSLAALLAAAEAANQGKRREEALERYREALVLDPENAQIHYKIANILNELGNDDESIAAYDAAIARKPDFANAYCNRGVVLARVGRVDAALQSYDDAIARNPADALACFNRSALLRSLARPADALASIERALEIHPGYAEAHCNRGILLAELDRPDDALASYQRALEIHPSFALAWFNRAVLLQKLRRPEEALTAYDRAIDCNPSYVEAHSNRGGLLTTLRRWPAALASLERAVAVRPDFAEAHCNLGNLCAASGRDEAAIAHFDRAIALKPDYADAFYNRGHALNRLGRLDAAIASFSRAIALEPDSPFLLGTLVHARMQVCDWDETAAQAARLAAAVEAGAPATPPFPAIALLDDPQIHRKAAQIWVREQCPADPTARPINPHPPDGRIRIGYFSADFHEHPVAVLMADVFFGHDRSAFEITAFSTGPDTRDDMRRRLERSFERFIDVRDEADGDVARLARSLQIDIAVDLGGHTGQSRTGIFALRAAPVQAAYLGYPGTLGAQYIDYVIGDRTVTPLSNQAHYDEKIVCLPGCYLPAAATPGAAPAADPAMTRESAGLPEDAFVFCCFNNSYKITPATFDGWMRILMRVPRSVLWLSQHNATAVRNLRLAAERRGVQPERLIFAPRLPARDAHWSRQRLADLFLDTRPYNAHATAIDALSAGLPVVTLCGAGFAGRVAASLLRTIGLPELITGSPVDYEELAVALAENRERLALIRRKLTESRHTAPLFDTARHTRHLESAYSRMYQRCQAGLAPDHIEIDP